MNDHRNQPRQTTVGRSVPPGASPSGSYHYRWSYGEQSTYEMRHAKKQRKNSLLVYATVMTVVFLLCFALLAGVLVWYQYGLPQPSGQGTAPGGESLSTGAVVDQMNPATVFIHAIGTTNQGRGTGFFIRSDGYIATNYHVIEGRYTINVTLYDGEVLEARIIGYSKADDLAVLKIEGVGYPVLKIGSSDAVRVGDTAIAVGHPSGDDAPWSATKGIISALDRKIDVESDGLPRRLTMLQTDAALNHGNSGGPLCNDRAEVIGVVARKQIDCEGVAYAIPINGAMEILNAIIKNGNAEGVISSISHVRPTIGIICGSVQKDVAYTYGGETGIAARDGVLVTDVTAGGAADGHLQKGDIVIAMDGEAIPDMEVLTDLLYNYRIGDRVTFRVWRNDAEINVSVTLH